MRLSTAVMLTAALGGVACEENESPASGPIELEFVRELVRPDTTPSTTWLGRSLDLTYDPTSGNLLAINLDEKHVFEADLRGRLVRKYGREGQGPGEFSNPLNIIVNQRGVFVFDLGNMKLARYNRSGASPFERRLDHYYYDVAAGWGEELLAIPGWGSSAVDVFDSDGNVVDGFGEREDLPGLCSSCMIAALGSDAVIVVAPDMPELIIIDRNGPLRRRIPLDGVPVLKQWREEQEDILARRPDIRGGGKNWVSDVAVLDASTILLAMSPTRPFDRGRELWKVDLSRDVITRYGYDHVEAGSQIAVSWPAVYTLLVREAAIREYRVPDEPGGTANAR